MSALDGWPHGFVRSPSSLFLLPRPERPEIELPQAFVAPPFVLPSVQNFRRRVFALGYVPVLFEEPGDGSWNAWACHTCSFLNDLKVSAPTAPQAMAALLALLDTRHPSTLPAALRAQLPHPLPDPGPNDVTAQGPGRSADPHGGVVEPKDARSLRMDGVVEP